MTDSFSHAFDASISSSWTPIASKSITPKKNAPIYNNNIPKNIIWPSAPFKPQKNSGTVQATFISPHPTEFVEISPASQRIWSIPSSTNIVPKSPLPSPSPNPNPNLANIEDEITGQNLYKTELCRSFEETGTCRYGTKCQFAHGMDEKRPVIRHPKYKTEVCKTFHTIGTCPYGKRCRFIHSLSEGSNDQESNDPSPPSSGHPSSPEAAPPRFVPQYNNNNISPVDKQMPPQSTPIYNTIQSNSSTPVKMPILFESAEWSTSWKQSAHDIVSPPAALKQRTQQTTSAPVKPSHEDPSLDGKSSSNSERRLAIFQHITAFDK